MAEPAWKSEWQSWLRGSSDPATIVLGPAETAAKLKLASYRELVSVPTGAPRLVPVDGTVVLCLPGGFTGKWLPHTHGGVLVRAPTNQLIPGTYKALLAAEQALGKVARWTPLTSAWQVDRAAYAMRAARADGEFWSLPAPIPDGNYAIDYAYTKAGRFVVQYYVFARDGVAPATVLAGVLAMSKPGAAVDTSLRQASRPEIAAAKKQRWLCPAETSILFIDHTASLAWNGVFDATGKNAIARGAPNDYERLTGAPWVSVGTGKTAHQALVLEGPAPSTWIALAGGGALIRHLSGELVASALGAAWKLAAGDKRAWKLFKGTFVVGARGARLLDAAARGQKPRAKAVLEIALPRGRYRLARGEAEGAVGIGGTSMDYRIEVWRVQKA